MASSSKVVVVIVGKDEISDVTRKVSRALQEMGSASEGAGRQAEGLSTKSIALGTAIGDLAGRAVQGFLSDLKNLARQSIQVASTYEQQEITLTRLLGSQELATAALEKWNDESVKTPFTPEQYKNAAITLKAFNFQLDEISKYMRAAGDAASAFGDKLSLDQMVDVFGRLKAGQFGEAMEQLRRIGISMQDLKGEGLQFDKGGQYVGSVDDALAAVEKIIEKRFGGMMEEQAKSAKGLVSTIQGNWESLLKTMMDSGPYDYIKRRLLDINDIVGYMNDSAKRSKADIWQGQVDQLKDTLNNVLRIQKEFIANGGSMTEWARLGLPDVKEIQKDIYAIADKTKALKEAQFGPSYSKDALIAETNIKTLDKYSETALELNAALQKAKGGSKDLANAMAENAAKNRASHEATSKATKEWEKLNKAIKPVQATVAATGDAIKKAAEQTDYYSDYLKKLEGESIPQLTLRYEALGKILNDSALMSKQTPETIQKLTDEFTELGVSIGRLDFDTSDMDGFVDNLEDVQKAADESLKSYQAIASLLPGLQGIWDWGGSPEAKETLSTAEQIAQEMMMWADGLAEFTDMLGLTSDELSEVAAGIYQIGQGIDQIAKSENLQQMFAGITSIGQGLAQTQTGDMEALLSGATNVGVGVARAISGDLTGIIQALAGLPDLFDGLTESFNESFNKQWSAQGFDDQLSDELIDKMEKVSDAMGGKEFGMRAYIEDIFAQVDISNKDEFSRLGDLLNEQMGAELAQGKTVEEVYAKYGDELQKLVAAQEQYGFETTASLEQMLALQREQTSEGRIGGITDAIGGIERMITGMSEAGYSEGSFASVFGLLQSGFQKLQAEGLSMQEIFEKVSPAVEKAREAAEKAGYSTEPMQALIDYYDQMSKAAPVLDVLSGLETAIEGLSSTGTLTQQNLTDMSKAASETYDKLQKAGFSETQIAQFMGPTIDQLQEAAEKFGFTLPKEIEDLAKKVETAGYEAEKTPAEEIADWGDKYLIQTKEWGDRMIETFRSLGEFAEGGVVPGSGSAPQLAWVHPGETVIPRGAVPVANNYNSTSQPAPIELKITLEEKSGGNDYLKKLVGVTVEAGTKHGEIKIFRSSLVDE